MKWESMDGLIEYQIKAGFHIILEKGKEMETREELMQSVFNERRKSFLMDMSFDDLEELCPKDYEDGYWEIRSYYTDLYGEDYVRKEYKRELIDYIMENYWDSQINPEVR